MIDGYNGTVHVNPLPEVRARFQEIVDTDLALTKDLESLRDLPCETLDGHRMPLWVNTGLMADVTRSLEQGAEGVGLYRTEVPFLLRERFPSEEEQRQIYREQLEAFAPLPVTMRTLDIGGDKALPYFPIEEDNPLNATFDPRYAELDDKDIPRTESLKEVIERMVPYWNDEIKPTLKEKGEVLVAAHGNSLRAVVKYLKNMSEEEILKFNIPTGIPYIFEFDEDMNFVKDYFIGDPEEIKKLMDQVANQAKKK